ncbi:unnamed protein product [Gongylonema pulchrum]|uniref:Uncharacterized protein n=1 Tax=Gongylonema pulchrum TaxID=637853 RepID=A0A3P7RM09_9BILA|nr:unnamed protein product [Gongylonema pulchrum]
MDVNVSAGLNHLLKSPFSVHPKTGLIAVPLTPDQMPDVDLKKLPRIDKLVRETSNMNGNNETMENDNTGGTINSSLAPYIATFEQFVNQLLIYEESDPS